MRFSIFSIFSIFFIFSVFYRFCFAIEIQLVDVSYKSPLFFQSEINLSGDYYTRIGSAQISINKIDRTKIGSICCHDRRDLSANAYFLKGLDGEDKVVRVLIKSNKTGPQTTLLSLFDIFGKLQSELVFGEYIPRKYIAISNNKKTISILYNKKIHIYSSDNFNLIGSVLWESEKDVDVFRVSDDGSMVLVGLAKGPLTWIDVNKNSFRNVVSNSRQGISVNFFGGLSEKLVLVSHEGFIEIIGDKKKERYSIDKHVMPKVVYGDVEDALVIFVSEAGIYVFDLISGGKLENFMIVPFYQNKFGKRKNKSKYYGPKYGPWFNGVIEYDPSLNTVFAESIQVGMYVKVKFNRVEKKPFERYLEEIDDDRRPTFDDILDDALLNREDDNPPPGGDGDGIPEGIDAQP